MSASTRAVCSPTASTSIRIRVLLLDEIEKAHPDLFNILLQIMDHGKLTDHNGKKVDFQNVILIMTTNAGRLGPRQGGDRLQPLEARRRRRGGDHAAVQP